VFSIERLYGDRWMATGATKIEHETAHSAAVSSAPAPRPKQKRQALLITSDDSLWPQVGAVVTSEVVLKHIDSVDQLLSTVEPGYAAIVIWDGRGESDIATQLAKIQRHSARLAIIAVDTAAMAAQWARLTQQNQIVSMVVVPFSAQAFNEAMSRAHDEVQTRIQLLGSADAPAQASTPAGRKSALLIGAGVVALVLVAVAGYFLFRNSSSPAVHAVAPVAAPDAARATAAGQHSGVDSVDALLEKAAQAMLERRYIEPADNSALGYYHSILAYDANNAEAKQGLDRLAELLLTKAQTALDQQHADSALQSLEIARGIIPGDARVQALDARLSKMRADLGSSLIQAAIDAGNYERASALIDEAARAKALTPAQLAQLRDDLKHRQSSSDVDRLIKTAQARVQQERLIDPANDSAAHYFALASKAGGAGSPALASAMHEYGQHLMLAARSAIDEHRLDEAERLLAQAQLCDVPPAALAELQHAAAGARSALAGEKHEQLRLIDLVKARVAQGNLLEPEQDSAVFYLASLKAANQQSEALPELSHTVQAQLVARAGSQFDQGRIADAQASLQGALKLGSSPEASALAAKLAQSAAVPAGADLPLKLLRPIATQYPLDAAARGTEGWVDLTFTVGPNGRTGNIQVIDSSPRKVFDRAATDAIAAARYEPVSKDQPQVTRDAKLRLTFKLNK
jgi:periplasmic protein TonB